MELLSHLIMYSLYINIVTCQGCACLIRQVFDWMIGFIDTLYIQLGNTGNCSSTAISTNSTVHRYTRIRVLSLH
jgi:hypothetical protein